jgi:hypothetical protein
MEERKMAWMRPVKYSLGIPKIDAAFCEVRLPLAFIALERRSGAFA